MLTALGALGAARFISNRPAVQDRIAGVKDRVQSAVANGMQAVKGSGAVRDRIEASRPFTSTEIGTVGGRRGAQALEPLRTRISALAKANLQLDEELTALQGAHAELAGYVAELQEAVTGSMDGMDMSIDYIAQLGGLLIESLNAGDVVQYPLALSAGNAIDAWMVMGKKDENTLKMAKTLGGVAKAYAYYDASVGLSSLWSKDAVATTTVTETSSSLLIAA